jgi:hypothetical protein
MNHAAQTSVLPAEGSLRTSGRRATVRGTVRGLGYAYAFFFMGYAYFYFYAFDMAGGF